MNHHDDPIRRLREELERPGAVEAFVKWARTIPPEVIAEASERLKRLAEGPRQPLPDPRVED